MTEPSSSASSPPPTWQISACLDILDELGAQVVEVSRLASLKHNRVRWAACFTLFSVLLWIVSLVTMVSIFWMHAV